MVARDLRCQLTPKDALGNIFKDLRKAIVSIGFRGDVNINRQFIESHIILRT